MKKILTKMTALQWSQHFSHCKSLEIFPDAQGQLTPQSKIKSGRNLNSSKLFMVNLVTCKNEEDQIKIEGARVKTSFLRRSRAANFVVCGHTIIHRFLETQWQLTS